MASVWAMAGIQESKGELLSTGEMRMRLANLAMGDCQRSVNSTIRAPRAWAHLCKVDHLGLIAPEVKHHQRDMLVIIHQQIGRIARVESKKPNPGAHLSQMLGQSLGHHMAEAPAHAMDGGAFISQHVDRRVKIPFMKICIQLLQRRSLSAHGRLVDRIFGLYRTLPEQRQGRVELVGDFLHQTFLKVRVARKAQF